MPFVKPKVQSFNIIIVGTKAHVLNGLFQHYRENKQLTERFLELKENWTYSYSRNGLKAQVKIWQSIRGLNFNTIMPNFFRRAHIVFIVSDYTELCEHNNDQKQSALTAWARLVAKECIDATRMLILHTETNAFQNINPKQMEKITLEHFCSGYCLLSNQDSSRSVNLLVRMINKILFTKDYKFYNNLEAAINQVDLATDRSNITNTTQCYERNGIA